MGQLVFLDSNLVVLLIAGLTDRGLFARHKRLGAYDEDGFDLLAATLQEFSKIAVTPNILTEASSLLRQIGDPDRTRLTSALGRFVQGSNEVYIASDTAVSHVAFSRLSLTDAAVLCALANYPASTLLSADTGLYLAAATAGLPSLNFAHLYEAAYG